MDNEHLRISAFLQNIFRCSQLFLIQENCITEQDNAYEKLSNTHEALVKTYGELLETHTTLVKTYGALCLDDTKDFMTHFLTPEQLEANTTRGREDLTKTEVAELVEYKKAADSARREGKAPSRSQHA